MPEWRGWKIRQHNLLRRNIPNDAPLRSRVIQNLTKGRVVIAIVMVVLVVIGVGYVLNNPSLPTGASNQITNGGFETGGLRGWQVNPSSPPTVESTTIQNGTFAARFQTTGNGQTLTQCTTKALQCSHVNSSTISQEVALASVSNGTLLSIAVNPQFQPPSVFQITLSWRSPNATIYYLLTASSDQCTSYSRLLTSTASNESAYCLSPQQGTWTFLTRNVAVDLPPATSRSALAGSTVSLSMSFAGGNPTDFVYVDSVDFG